MNLYNINMQGGRQEFQLASPLISVRPIRYSFTKIITILAIIAVLLFLLLLQSYRWTIVAVLLVVFNLFYLWASNHPLFLMLFYSVQSSDSESITKYAINDLSYPSEQDLALGGRKSNHLFIAKVHFQKDGIRYFHFKEQLFKVQDGGAAPVNQSDILKLLSITDFREYLRNGLSGERMRTSLELFKVQSRFLKPALSDFVKKRLCEELQLSLANLFILLVAFLVVGSTLLSLVLLVIDATIFTLILRDQCGKVEKFTKKFASFTQKKFLVEREGQSGRVAFNDILVGDIIEIEKGGAEDEYMTSFRCLLLGNFQVICKEGASRQQSIKKPVRQVAEVSEQRKSRYVIRPLSYIQKASLRGNEHLIVMENHSISKFFAMWFQKWKYAEYAPLHRQTLRKILYLFGFGVIILIAIHFLFVFITGAALNPYNRDEILAIISCLFLTVAVVQLLFCISHHKHIKNLQSCNIQTFGVDLTRAGTVSNIAINFSELLQLQFQEILYKNLIFDPSNRPFEPDAGTLQNGRTYESLLAIILYISMGYFDQQQNKSTFLRVIYQLFENYFQYQETLDDTKIILHKSTNRVWRLIHKDPENQAGLRSWRILYENQLKYVLTEFNILSKEQDFARYVGSEDQNRMDIYASLAESLMEEGKKIKLLMFKSYKKDNVSLRDTEIVNHTEEEFMHVSRNHLEKNMEFAAFIVFDNALKAQNKKIIEFLRDVSDEDGRIFRLSVYSHSKNQNLAGFEHILESVPIHYSLKSHQKASMAREKMHSGGTLVVGTDIDDAYAELVSDMSVRIVSALEEENKVQRVLLPADFCIQGLGSLKELLSNGMDHAHFKIQAVKYILVVWFWVSLGWVVMISGGKGRFMRDSQLWAILILLILVLLPLLAKKMLEAPGNMKDYKKCLQVFTFSWVSQISLSVFMATIIIIVGFNDICKAQTEILPNESHMLLRNVHNLQSQTYTCTNLPLILGGSASVLFFTIFFGEERSCISGHFQWWRFIVTAAQFAMMLIAAVPLKIFFLCIGVVIFLFGLKIMIRFVGPSPTQGSLKQSQNAETEIE